MRDYASFLQRHTPAQLTSVHSADDHRNRIARFLGDRATVTDHGIQDELLTWDRLRGRYLSSSLAGEDALDELRALFDRYESDNVVPLRLTWTCISCDSF